MRKPSICSLVLGLLLCSAGASALEKPTVQVLFSLAEPVYRGEYSASEIHAIETDISGFLTQRLSDEIGFLQLSTTGADFTLTFRLGNPGAPDKTFHQVDFFISLAGPEVLDVSTRWLFRNQNLWGVSTGSQAQFETEIRGKLALPGNLVPKVLSSIPVAQEVAQEGVLIHDPAVDIAWILPFRQADLCMDLKSQVKLATEVASSLGTMPGEFLAEAIMVYNPQGQAPQEELRHRLLCIPLPKDQTGLDMVRQSAPANVRVKQVFIMSYRRIPSGCQGPLPPAEAAATLGGGQ